MSYYFRHDLLCLLEVKGMEKRNWYEAIHFEGKEKASKAKCGKDHVKRMCWLRVTDSSDYLYHPSERDIEESLV